MEVGAGERIIPGHQVMVLVCLNVLNLVSPPNGTESDREMLTNFRVPSGGITTFGPLIIQSFGLSSYNTMLFNIPFGAVQLVATMGSAWLATVWKMKGPVLALLCLPPIAGCVMLLQITHDDANKGPLLAAYYIVSVELDQRKSLTAWIRSLCTQPSVSTRSCWN